MAIHGKVRKRIKQLKADYLKLRVGKDSLLELISETEMVESVYNSNAIENSTLTLAETEKILLELEVAREVNVREMFEAKNLARVMEHIHKIAPERKLSTETILLMHRMLLTNINDCVAGRFRQVGEYVRVGTHIAPAPEHVEQMMASLLLEYKNDIESYFLDRVAKFHLEFETIHPFSDGNGRIGRAIMNYQIIHHGLPPIIIRDKEKRKYYQAFKKYQAGDKTATKPMETIIALTLLESLHKRITYLRGQKIIAVSKYAKRHNKHLNAILNSAKRQTIPAFREKGVWRIGEDI